MTTEDIPASAPSPRAPVPDTEELKAAQAAVKQTYRAELVAARLPDQKQKLAVEIKLAGMGADDPVQAFALLAVARDLAIPSGFYPTALACVDELNERFEIDALKLKLDCVSGVVKSTRVAWSDFYGQCLTLIDQMVQADRYDLAARCCTVALQAARKANDAKGIPVVNARTQAVRDIAKAYAGLKDALVTLQQDPSDATANLAVGRFQCFQKGDWESGLPHFQQGADAELKSLAEQEAARPTELKSVVALADGWWDFAEGDPVSQLEIRRHAGELYGPIARQCEGSVRARILKRFDLLGISLASQKGMVALTDTHAHFNQYWSGPPGSQYDKAQRAVVCAAGTDKRGQSKMMAAFTYPAPWQDVEFTLIPLNLENYTIQLFFESPVGRGGGGFGLAQSDHFKKGVPVHVRARYFRATQEVKVYVNGARESCCGLNMSYRLGVGKDWRLMIGYYGELDVVPKVTIRDVYVTPAKAE